MGYNVDCVPHTALASPEFWNIALNDEFDRSIKDSIKCELDSMAIVDINLKNEDSGYNVDCVPHTALVSPEFWNIALNDEFGRSIKDSIKCELDSTAIVDINLKTGKIYKLDEILKIVSASNRLSVSPTLNETNLPDVNPLMECFLNPDFDAPEGYNVDCVPHTALVSPEFWNIAINDEFGRSIKDSINCELDSTAIVDINLKTATLNETNLPDVNPLMECFLKPDCDAPEGYNVDCIPYTALVSPGFWNIALNDEFDRSIKDSIKCELDSTVIVDINLKTGKIYKLDEILKIVSASNRRLYLVTFTAKVQNDDSAASETFIATLNETNLPDVNPLMECFLKPDCDAPGPYHYSDFIIQPMSIKWSNH
ncbi:hypothetical protein OROMI_026021 [Orobanche minor]